MQVDWFQDITDLHVAQFNEWRLYPQKGQKDDLPELPVAINGLIDDLCRGVEPMLLEKAVTAEATFFDWLGKSCHQWSKISGHTRDQFLPPGFITWFCSLRRHVLPRPVEILERPGQSEMAFTRRLYAQLLDGFFLQARQFYQNATVHANFPHPYNQRNQAVLPDYLLYLSKSDQVFIVAEDKPGNSATLATHPDFTKLLVEMRLFLRNMVQRLGDKGESARVFGFLEDGFGVRLLCMRPRITVVGEVTTIKAFTFTLVGRYLLNQQIPPELIKNLCKIYHCGTKLKQIIATLPNVRMRSTPVKKIPSGSKRSHSSGNSESQGSSNRESGTAMPIRRNPRRGTGNDELLEQIQHLFPTCSRLKSFRQSGCNAALFTGRSTTTTGHDHKVLIKVASSSNHETPREIQVLQKLAGCKYIIELENWRFLDQRNGVYAALFPRKQSLLENPPKTVREITSCIEDIANALHYCHALGVIHRDVKQDNICFDQATRTFVLIDFDHASTHCPATSRAGTPMYCAPEIDGLQPYTTAVDIWSLGNTLFIALWCHTTHVGILLGELLLQKFVPELPSDNPIHVRTLLLKELKARCAMQSLTQLFINMTEHVALQRYTSQDILNSLLVLKNELPQSIAPAGFPQIEN